MNIKVPNALLEMHIKSPNIEDQSAHGLEVGDVVHMIG